MHKIIIIVMATKLNVEVIVKAIKVMRSAQGEGNIAFMSFVFIKKNVCLMPKTNLQDF